MGSATRLLDRIESYFAAAVLPDAQIEVVGGLDVPIGSPAWPHPARPTPGGGPITVADLQRAGALLREARLPVGVEWIAEQQPHLAGTARSAGLVVEELPLLLSLDPVEVLLPPGVRLYLIGADDPRLPYLQQLTQATFTGPASAVAGWPSGRPDATADGSGWPVPAAPGEPWEGSEVAAVLRDRVGTGRTVMMVAVENGEPVAVGSHQPVRLPDGELSEVVGVTTLPRFRGRGLGAGLSSALVEHARQTSDVVFLSAGDDDVARVYERVGFARVGTTCVAEPR